MNKFLDSNNGFAALNANTKSFFYILKWNPHRFKYFLTWLNWIDWPTKNTSIDAHSWRAFSKHKQKDKLDKCLQPLLSILAWRSSAKNNILEEIQCINSSKLMTRTIWGSQTSVYCLQNDLSVNNLGLKLPVLNFKTKFSSRKVPWNAIWASFKSNKKLDSSL